MLDIQENVPLKDHTTFHIGGPAKFFAEAFSVSELSEAIAFGREKSLPTLILGGGSNMLVSDRGFDGLVISPKFKGFSINGDRVTIAAGEIWDECVKRIVEAGLWGVENLSFVPGYAAGLAIQNVGAYGQEAASVIESVEAWDTVTNDEIRMTNDECKFGYRTSIFNTTEKGRYVILAVTLKLSKQATPNTSYRLEPGTLQQMRDQVIAIRKSKGQDPSEFWSAGSFFKNVVLDGQAFEKLSKEVQAGAWPLSGGQYKIPAGFLLDKLCNLKGLTFGGAKLSELQVINIINTGSATAEDVLSLFKKARDTVYAKTGILLANEPELVGFTEAELEKHFAL